MENASRALTIAGTVLISIMVITALIFAFREIRGVENQESNNEQTEAIIEFNKSFEAYDKELYGTELMSLDNKIEDYNNGKDVKYSGYEKIKLSVLKKDGKTKSDYQNVRDDVKELTSTYISTQNLETLYEANEIIEDSTSQRSKVEAAKTQIKEICTNIGKTSWYNNYSGGLTTVGKNNVNNAWEIYNKYKNFKNSKYKCISVEYSKNGRINKMTFQAEQEE